MESKRIKLKIRNEKRESKSEKRNAKTLSKRQKDKREAKFIILLRKQMASMVSVLLQKVPRQNTPAAAIASAKRIPNEWDSNVSYEEHIYVAEDKYFPELGCDTPCRGIAQLLFRGRRLNTNIAATNAAFPPQHSGKVSRLGYFANGKEDIRGK